MLRTLLILGRVSNLPTVWTNVLAGWFLGGGLWSWELLWLGIGVSLLYIAGMTLNDAFDVEWDRRHAPERPIPSGAIRVRAVWAAGTAQMVLGAVAIVAATGAAGSWLAALVAAILFYDWIHKKTVLAAPVMGLCRGLVYLLAASACAGMSAFPGLLWILTGSMILYVTGITVSARSERRPETPKWEGRLGKALQYAPVAVLVTAPDRMEDAWIRAAPFLTATLLAIGWIAISAGFLKTDKRRAIPLRIAGICLVDGAVLVFGNPLAAAVCFCLLPVTLLFQARIPAT